MTRITRQTLYVSGRSTILVMWSEIFFSCKAFPIAKEDDIFYTQLYMCECYVYNFNSSII